MAMYVYSTRGEPVGFVMETFIHTMEGMPVGRIMGSRVHRLDGGYVGEFFKDMVVAKPDGRRDREDVARPPRRVPPPKSFNKRVVLHNGYEDTFHLLTVAVDEPEYQEAAE